MSKKRPGVEAGINLVALDDPGTWERVEEHCASVIESIPNLTQYESSLESLGKSKEFFTKAELDKVVVWKHTVGKNRIYNVKYLNANADEYVRKHSRQAIALANSIRTKDCLESDGSLNADGKKAISDAIGELGKLKGVGPATASAVLTLVRPDLFCYLYDEVIDCFEPQRDYKISNYLRVNSRCLQIAKTLGGSWTSSRVAKTIWTAARFLAANGEDLSLAHQRKKKGAKRTATTENDGDDDREGEGDEDCDDEEDEEEEEEEEEDDEDEDDDDDDEEEVGEEEEEAEPDAVAKMPSKKRPRKAE